MLILIIGRARRYATTLMLTLPRYSFFTPSFRYDMLDAYFIDGYFAATITPSFSPPPLRDGDDITVRHIR